MLDKLFVIASLALSTAQAQSSSVSAAPSTATTTTFHFNDVYPEPHVVPSPKAEWLDLIKNVNITNAPVLKLGPDGTPQKHADVEGDPYCVWTFTQCLRPDDLYTCPDGQWSVTFDDGPSEFSPQLYDHLDKANKKVTFFMVGGQVLRYPELVKRAYEAGHEIAMHSWSHSYMTTLTNEQLVAELKWNEQVIKEVIGVSPKYFRPPFGNIDDRVRDIATALGFTPVIWSHDTNDWQLTSGSGLQSAWFDGNVTEWTKTAAGGMSLEHDLYKETVEAAIRIFPTFEQAWDLKTVGQCNNLPSYKEGNGTSSSPASATAQASGSTAFSASAASSSQVAQNLVNPDNGAATAALSSATLFLAVLAAFWTA